MVRVRGPAPPNLRDGHPYLRNEASGGVKYLCYGQNTVGVTLLLTVPIMATFQRSITR